MLHINDRGSIYRLPVYPLLLLRYFNDITGFCSGKKCDLERFPRDLVAVPSCSSLHLLPRPHRPTPPLANSRLVLSSGFLHLVSSVSSLLPFIASCIQGGREFRSREFLSGSHLLKQSFFLNVHNIQTSS